MLGNFVLAVRHVSHVTYITYVNYEMEQSCFKFELSANLAKKLWCWNQTEARQFDNVNNSPAIVISELLHVIIADTRAADRAF